MPIGSIDIKGAGEAVGAIGGLFKDIRAAITGKEIIDPDTQLKLAALDSEIQKAQAAINLAEAGSASLFVSGWRPFLGWVGGLAFAVQFLIRPLLGAFKIEVPNLDVNELWPMLAGILGLGTLRTAEKIKSVAAK